MQDVKKGIIAICDDQEYIVQQLQQLIETICADHGANWEVRTYLSGDELLEHLSELSVVFLDIEMPGMDGIELGKILRENNPECKIIMATGTVERFKEAFHIHAMRFVTKPFVREEVEEALMAAIGDSPGGAMLEVYQERNLYEIRQADIWYLKAFNGYTIIVVDGKTFRKDISLINLEKQLDEKIFARVNRNVIVNLRFAEVCKKAYVKISEEKMTISKRNMKEFEHKYMEYDLRYGGTAWR